MREREEKEPLFETASGTSPALRAARDRCGWGRLAACLLFGVVVVRVWVGEVSCVCVVWCCCCKSRPAWLLAHDRKQKAEKELHYGEMDFRVVE